ncbi:Threonine/serine exporter [Ruminococcaceae bacterium BL-6]|nr:Threonine/serine exporter [Ruminococcaceae bacterium BL-6]
MEAPNKLDAPDWNREKELFDLVIQMGELILVNGGEIYRAHETMLYAARNFGLTGFQDFIIANGIFASVIAEGHVYSTQIRWIPLVPTELCRVEAVNELSREVAEGRCTPEELREKLQSVKTMKASGEGLQILASGFGAASFCYLFQGTWADTAVAFGAGIALYWFLLKVLHRISLPKIMETILSSAVSSLFCLFAFRLGFGDDLNHMILGAIFPLVPGVPLTNAVRNLLENDYLSGLVRLADALLTAGCIAIGVGMVLTLGRLLGGGF